MTASIRVALCQLNPLIGDFHANEERIVEAYRQAESQGAQLAVFPELVLSGFVPEDLLLRSDFLDASMRALDRLVARLDGQCAAVFGLPYRGDSGTDIGPAALYDAAVVVRNGQLDGVWHKRWLSSEGALDEPRYFAPGNAPGRLVSIGDVDVQVLIGEDPVGVCGCGSSGTGSPALIVNPVASPYSRGVQAERERAGIAASATLGSAIVSVNGVGGCDDIVFDGGSFVVADGKVLHRCLRSAECVDIVDVPLGSPTTSADRERAQSDQEATAGTDSEEELWSVLVLGLRDYVEKNGFGAVVLGLSGGVDSALVAALATDALGPERVHGVLMPSRYSSEGSVVDASALANNLGVESRTIPIEPAHAAFESMLAESFSGLAEDVTEENLQARVRGVILMSLSNKFGWLVLVTGNRSESFVGYSTLYGDSAGGLAPIQDVDKETVYALCRWYNNRVSQTGGGAVIPEQILTKAPSAELRPGQRDDQSLPPYSVLDPLLDAYVNRGESISQIAESGVAEQVVARVSTLVDRSEYKRHQAAPGLIVTRTSHGLRRSMPMTRATTAAYSDT